MEKVTPKTCALWAHGYRESKLVKFEAFSDGVRWKASIDKINSEFFVPSPGKRLKSESVSDLTYEGKRLFAWALTLSADADIERPQDESARSVVFDIDGESANLTLIGYRKKVGAYDQARIEQILERGVRVCSERWGWLGTDLIFELHSSDKTMGLAYRSGAYSDTGCRRISLSRKLFLRYDAESIYRTVIHELCHHYREETFPKSRGDSHDKVFCDALRLVDPVVHDEKSCQFFHEEVDQAVIEKTARGGKPPIWSPEAGTIVVKHPKSGKYRWDWVPNEGFKWARFGGELGDDDLLMLLKAFAPSDWQKVKIVGPQFPETLLDFVRRAISRWPTLTLKTRAFLNENAR